VTTDDEPSVATTARIYDYFLGGTHNFAADRAAAEALLQIAPVIQGSARVNRAFLGRAVRYLTGVGVRQFLDIGSGIPTAGNVHEVAPDSRVVYVDIDPTAVALSLELLAGTPSATALPGDLHDPDAILAHPDLRSLLDLGQPVGLIFASVLHFVDDDAEAYAVVERLLAALAPGSFLVLSHGSLPDGTADGTEERARGVYDNQTVAALRLRERAAVERFFAGLDLVEPGLVWAPQWHPAADDPTDFIADPKASGMLAGVGRWGGPRPV
jgi:SAM-dependent methyltransferase